MRAKVNSDGVLPGFEPRRLFVFFDAIGRVGRAGFETGDTERAVGAGPLFGTLFLLIHLCGVNQCHGFDYGTPPSCRSDSLPAQTST